MRKALGRLHRLYSGCSGGHMRVSKISRWHLNICHQYALATLAAASDWDSFKGSCLFRERELALGTSSTRSTPSSLLSTWKCCILLVRDTSVIHLLFLYPVEWLWRALEGNGPAWKNLTKFTAHLIGESDQWRQHCNNISIIASNLYSSVAISLHKNTYICPVFRCKYLFTMCWGQVLSHCKLQRKQFEGTRCKT